MSRTAPRPRDVVPDPKPNVPQALGLVLYGIAVHGKLRLSDALGCERWLTEGRSARPNLNDVAAGRRHAIDFVQHAARHLTEACNAALDEIERATIAGPDAHGAALARLSEILTAALARGAAARS